MAWTTIQKRCRMVAEALPNPRAQELESGEGPVPQSSLIRNPDLGGQDARSASPCLTPQQGTGHGSTRFPRWVV